MAKCEGKVKNKRKRLAFLMITFLLTAAGCSKEMKNTGNAEHNSTAAETQAAREKAESGTLFDEAGHVASQEPGKNDEARLHGRRICIDPGHQAAADNTRESIAPGSTETKERMTTGTTGTVSHTPEYALNLTVSLKLRDALLKQGAVVSMTRESNTVKLGNIERAQLANNARSELAVRIHTDGLDNPSVRGISVLYPGSAHGMDSGILARSKLAAQMTLEGLIRETGAVSRGLSERNDLTGFNWSAVPVILIEMGFMTNPEEDRLLNTDEYQDKLVRGMVEGIIRYFDSADY